jgi:hypothetical protein
MAAPTPTSPVPVDRPNPLGAVAQKVGVAWSAAAAVLGAAVSFGVLSAAQAEALNAVGMALPGAIVALGTIAGAVIPLLGGVAAAFGVAKVGKHEVTPVADPRDDQGRALTPDRVAADPPDGPQPTGGVSNTPGYLRQPGN